MDLPGQPEAAGDAPDARDDSDLGYPSTPDGVIALIEEVERSGVWPRGIRGDALRTMCYVSADSRSSSAEERAAWSRAEARLRQHFHGDRGSR
jgi:hypothetical protein